MTMMTKKKIKLKKSGDFDIIDCVTTQKDKNMIKKDKSAKSKKFSVIKAQFGGRLFDGGRFQAGDVVVMFPRSFFISEDDDGHKKFMNTYMKLNDLQKYPQYDGLRQEIRDQYGIEPDTFGMRKTIWRH